MEVEAGPDGFARFLDDVRSLFGISADLSMDLNFDCVEPTSGEMPLCFQSTSSDG